MSNRKQSSPHEQDISRNGGAAAIDKRLSFDILPLIQPSETGLPINLDEIKRVCSCGLSECPSEDRCIAWLCLLKVFPENPLEWSERKQYYVDSYNQFKTMFQLEDYHDRVIEENPQPDVFNMNAKQNRIMALIHADIVRTIRHIMFIQSDPNPPEGAEDGFAGCHSRNMRRIERMLYIFASLNPSLSYLQGFNELIVPLYYVNLEAIHYLDDDIDVVEAITFKCFQELIISTEIHEFYTTADNSSIIRFKMNRYRDLMRSFLPETEKLIEDLGITPLQYGFKWFNLLFAQEYQLPDVLIIWDSLFSHIDDMMEFVFCVAIAHVKEIKDLLRRDDFSHTITTLQNPRSNNICRTLREANMIYQMDRAPSMKNKVFSIFKKFTQPIHWK